MLNNVVMMGRVTGDPELRSTSAGVEVTSFRIAVDRDYVKPGEDRKTDFFDVVAWRGLATFVCRYFHKGSLIAVSGSLQTRMYEDKNGNKRTAIEIVAEKINFCERKNKDDASERRDVHSETETDPVAGEDDMDPPF